MQGGNLRICVGGAHYSTMYANASIRADRKRWYVLRRLLPRVVGFGERNRNVTCILLTPT